MKIKINKPTGILRVTDTFATMIESNDKTYGFEFYVSFKQSEIVKNDANKLQIDILAGSLAKKQEKERPITVEEKKKFVKSKLTQIPQLIAKKQLEQDTQLVSTQVYDLSTFLNTEAVTHLKNGVEPNQIESLNKTKLVVERSNDQVENTVIAYGVVHPSNVSVEDVYDSTRSIQVNRVLTSLVYKHGIDPSSVVNQRHRSVSSKDLFQGLSTVKKIAARQDSDIDKYCDYLLLGGSDITYNKKTDDVDDTSIVVQKTTTLDEKTIKLVIFFPKDKFMSKGVKNDILTCRFIIKSEVGKLVKIIDSTIRSLSLSKHSAVFNTPRLPPTISVTKSDLSTKAFLSIKQNDSLATAVNLYKRDLHRTYDDTDYTFVCQYQLTSTDQSLLVLVPYTNSSVAYRAISVNKFGDESFEFSNAIIKSNSIVKAQNTSVTLKSTNEGILISINKISPETTSIKVLRRNATIHELKYTQEIKTEIISQSIRSTDSIDFVDNKVVDNNHYQYMAITIDEFGNESEVLSQPFEYIKENVGIVDTSINDLEINSSELEPNVTFTIKTNLINSDVDVVQQYLKQNNLEQYFAQDIAQLKDNLMKIISYGIYRTNITNGTREFVGNLNTTTFSDRELRKNNATKALEYGKSYRYEVETYVNKPNVLLTKTMQTTIDPISKRSYTFQPSKWQHPKVIKTGTLHTDSGIKTLFGKDVLAHGSVGSIAYADVQFPKQRSKIKNALAQVFDESTAMLTWDVLGSIDDVDHYLIVKKAYGIKTIIGKAHSQINSNKCVFYHDLTDRDIGQHNYVIIPVHVDYVVSTPVSTNTIIVT